MEKLWERQDVIISHLVRTDNMNLAVEAGKIRDYILEILQENEALKRRIEKLEHKS